MVTIHDNIDELLAADVHDQLTETERVALHNHLVDCADCRKIHQETKVMHRVLEERFEDDKPDAALERRMLTTFRRRIPLRRGLFQSFFYLARLRPIQIAAGAVALLALVGIGRWLTTGPSYWWLKGGATAITTPIPAPGSLGELRDRLALTEIKADPFLRQALGRMQSRVPPIPPPDAQVQVEDLSSPAPSGSGPTSVDTYRKDDVPRFGVQSRAGFAHSKSKTESSETGRGGSAPNEETTVEQNSTEAEKPGAANEEPAQAVSAPAPSTTPSAAPNRKLIRNATVELEIANFEEAVQKITAFTNEEHGYIATTSSEKQENGKLEGEIVVKVVPENLDRFLQRIRGLGELKNQTLGTEDVTKGYFDTDARLKNARVMEQRLIEMLKKKSDDINDLLQVEKELGRVREEIERMQGDLKYWDAQVQFATVTISLAEKDLEEAAKYLLKERAQLALYSPEVETVYNNIKALASSKVQITNAQLDRDNAGHVSGRVSMLIAPEESDGVIAKVKAMGRVENFQMQTERVAQGGDTMSENATTKRDKVELNITISRDEQEQPLQQTTLRIRTSAVDEKTKALRALAEKQNGRVRSSTFNKDADGRESADVLLRVPMKNYNALLQSLDSLGKVEDVSVLRQDRDGVDPANAPADLSIQVYSQGNIVSKESGLFATLRRTIAQSVDALMWSLRMIGVAIAFLGPWVIALIGMVWIARRIARTRQRAGVK